MRHYEKVEKFKEKWENIMWFFYILMGIIIFLSLCIIRYFFPTGIDLPIIIIVLLDAVLATIFGLVLLIVLMLIFTGMVNIGGVIISIITDDPERYTYPIDIFEVRTLPEIIFIVSILLMIVILIISPSKLLL